MATAGVSGSATQLKSKLSYYFGAHGHFCASHPWEVIVSIVTLTVCALSVSVLSGGGVGTVCGFSKPCQPKAKDEEVADTLLLSIVNCLAVIYIYRQFSRLRKAGSKYLLGIAGLFAIFSSFVFGTTVVSIIDSQVSGLNEALPFFLLLIDLSKASALAKMAFKAKTKEEVRGKIGEGIASLGPTMTLDTLVEILLISIGTISGVPKFETVCCFGCISIAASYLVFMTFFPASLALVLEVCPHDPSNSGWHLDNLARDMQEEEVTKKPNPVAQRVKIIMALGLTVVHMHSWVAGLTGWHFIFPASVVDQEKEVGLGQKTGLVKEDMEMVPLHTYLYWKLFNLSIDQLIAIGLATVLFAKYIAYDKSEPFSSSVPATPTTHLTTPPSSSSTRSTSSATAAGTCPFTFPRNAVSTTSHVATSSQSPGIDSCLTSSARASMSSIRNLSSLVENGISLDQEAPVTNGSLALTHSTKSTKNAPVATVSIGTQTEWFSDVSDSRTTKSGDVPLFTLGEVHRKESLASSCSDNSSDNHSREASPPLVVDSEPRDVSTCLEIFKSDRGAEELTDEEIIALVDAKHIPAYKLETSLKNHQRGVAVRRQLLTRQLTKVTSCPDASRAIADLPFTHYSHYPLVNGACCENVIGYMPVPVGYAGPLVLDGTSYMVPMATTEGALVASTNRGCRALATAGGVRSSILGDGMTRGPVVRLPSASQASQVKVWLDNEDNFQLIKEAFESTSSFATLQSVHTAIAGRLLFIRFKATTGDAMGMNMISKGVDRSLEKLKEMFPLLEIISISGNFCTDKKAAAINWLEGRGKSVVCEATIPAQTVAKVLKTTVAALIELNVNKNLVGSAMAGSIGGFNAHASNIVTAIFIATGQDPAQNVASSNCMTLMEPVGPTGEDLYITCTMPSIEVGTVGGGTGLPPQGACLEMLGLKGGNSKNPGANATQLARVVCATVLAGELSLLSALATGDLVKSHLKLNRSNLNLSSIAEGVEEKERRASVPFQSFSQGPASHRRASSPINS